MAQQPQRFADILNSHLPAGQALQPGVPLRDRGIDSFAVVGLIMDLEAEFDVVILDEQVAMETFDPREPLWLMVSVPMETPASGPALR